MRVAGGMSAVARLRAGAVAALLAAVLGGCGPDCERYCTKLAACAAAVTPGATFDVPSCLAECDAVGDEKARVIACVIDHSCTELVNAGHCSPTGQQPRLP